MTPQCARVLAALRHCPQTQAMWLNPPDGPPVLRLAARIKALRADGYEIRSDSIEGSPLARYVPVAEPEYRQSGGDGRMGTGHGSLRDGSTRTLTSRVDEPQAAREILTALSEASSELGETGDAAVGFRHQSPAGASDLDASLSFDPDGQLRFAA